jgi:DNA-binding transcriptional ArsR family regulator
VVWELASPGAGKLDLLKEHLAARLVAGELKPSSPADAPLIQPAREALTRLEPAAGQRALACLYEGGFRDARIRVDPAVRQLQRFDRLLETAGEVLLAVRYPKFPSVAPKRFAPTARVYQQLLEDFVMPGSIALSEARSRSLSPAIDGLAVPLGIVEVRRGSYVYSPDSRGHPLLVYVFAQLDPAAAVPLQAVLGALERGPFGLPHETALFLLSALVVGGLVVARRKGRSIPLEFLSLSAVESAEEIGLGELLAEADRRALQEDCPFLFPSPSEGTFGLRQQREAWKEAVRFRASLESTLPGIASSLERLRDFASLSGLDLEEVERRVRALTGVKDEIKVSYGAKEGLERFLAAWRNSRLEAGAVEGLRSLGKFFARGVDEFIFTSHYARHQAVAEAAGRSPELSAAQARLLGILEDPAAQVVADGGEAMRASFAELRELYVERYEAAHAAANRRPERLLDRAGERALGLLRALAAVPGLDRAPGLVAFLERMDGSGRTLCTRHVREELLRAPLCGCGFRPGDESPAKAEEPSGEAMSGFLRGYVQILRSPRILEALSARSFALQDADPAQAHRLTKLREALSSAGLSSAHLADVLDPGTCRELGEALSRKLDVRSRDLRELTSLLAGRRLEPARLEELFTEWIGEAREASLVAVEEGALKSAEPPTDPASWWRVLRPELARAPEPVELHRLEALLEARFPAAELRSALESLATPALVELLRTERFHFRLLGESWAVLARRAMAPGHRAVAAAELEAHGPALQPDPATRRAVERRIELVRRVVTTAEETLPRRMGLRIPLEQIARDAWATEEVKRSARALLEETEELAAGWLRTLPAVIPLELGDAPLLLVVDAAPADLWCAAEERLAEILRRAGGTGVVTWHRLEAQAVTAPALGALLGLRGDPVVELDSRGIPYRTLSGEEPGEVLDAAGPIAAGTAAVVRVAALDRLAHAGEASLEELAERLEGFVTKKLEPLLGFCRSQGRRLVLTTDHGLSLARGRLVHGKGGAYEQAIFRLEWSP